MTAASGAVARVWRRLDAASSEPIDVCASRAARNHTLCAVCLHNTEIDLNQGAHKMSFHQARREGQSWYFLNREGRERRHRAASVRGPSLVDSRRATGAAMRGDWRVVKVNPFRGQYPRLFALGL